MAVVEAVASKVSYNAGHVAAGTTIYFGLTLNEVGILAGIACSVTMVVINVWATLRRDRREERAAQDLEGREQ